MKKNIALGLVVVTLFGYGVLTYIQKKEASYVMSLQTLVEQQQSILINLSELTSRNTIDPYASAIISDCPTEERIRFDELLGTLNVLSRPQLIELNQLFTGCASYDAQQKALMTARLEREVDMYLQLVDVLQGVNQQNTQDYNTDQWEQMVKYEKQRTEIAQKLVEIQKDIIVLLLEGKSVNSSEIRDLLEQAQEAKDTFSYLRVKIDDLNKQINAK